MSFLVSDKLQSTFEEIRKVMQEDVYPLEKDFLNHAIGFNELVPSLHAVRQRVKERGLWAPYLPEKYGGVGFTLAGDVCLFGFFTGFPALPLGGLRASLPWPCKRFLERYRDHGQSLSATDLGSIATKEREATLG